MCAYALNDNVLSVEYKTLVGVADKLSEPYARVRHITENAVAVNVGFDAVENGRIDVPYLRIFNFRGVSKRCLIPFGSFRRLRCGFRYDFSVLRDNAAFGFYAVRLVFVVPNSRFKIDAPFSVRNFLCGSVNAPEIGRNAVRFYEPNVAVDAAALVPPALAAFRVDVNGKNVFVLFPVTETRVVGYVGFKRDGRTEVSADETAVEIDLRICRNALKVKGNAPALVLCGKCEMFSVPGVFVVEETARVVVFLARRLSYHIVVRKIYALPAA